MDLSLSSLSSSSIPNRIIMLVMSVIKKLLWAFRYPCFAPESGPYRVGAIQTRIPGSVQCQIHYPISSSSSVSSSSSFYPYFRPNAVKGLADYSATSADLLSFLSNRNHPCKINGDPMNGKSSESLLFPLVIFSHGLGGCMEMYTQLCLQVASYGYCVVALEHEDGSGCYAENENGKPIYYKRPDDTPYSRQKVVKFRRPFLEQRVDETTRVLEYIFSTTNNQNKNSKSNDDISMIINNNDDDDDSSLLLLNKILQSVDTSSGKVSLVGHSFGGATMVMAAQELHNQKSNNNNNNKDRMAIQQQQQQQIQPTSLTVLDPWVFSLDDETLSQGIPEGIPTLSILSEGWLTNPETRQVDQLLKNCRHPDDIEVVSLYAPNSIHASVADSVSWLPGVLLKRLGLRGKNEKKFVTFEAAANVLVQLMQSGKVDDIGILKEYQFGNKSASAARQEEGGEEFKKREPAADEKEQVAVGSTQ